MQNTPLPLPDEALSHLDALYSLARWLARDPTQAEDLVQETYLRALRAAHQFQAGTNLRAWMFQIMRNTFISQMKRKKWEPDQIDPEALDGLLAQRGSWGGEARAGQGLAGPADGTAGLDLTAALDRLPEEYRTVVLLADLEDFTMPEIARIMECPVGTVKSRLFRARGILKELLRDYLHEDGDRR
jgi:RNA polymerase sigma-70 factor (ECF subfamily)